MLIVTAGHGAGDAMPGVSCIMPSPVAPTSYSGDR
jgi:hypothetical protein